MIDIRPGDEVEWKKGTLLHDGRHCWFCVTAINPDSTAMIELKCRDQKKLEAYKQACDSLLSLFREYIWVPGKPPWHPDLILNPPNSFWQVVIAKFRVPVEELEVIGRREE